MPNNNITLETFAREPSKDRTDQQNNLISLLISNPMLAPHVTRASVNSWRVLVFVVPVAILSVVLNGPRFLDLEVTEDGNREEPIYQLLYA